MRIVAWALLLLCGFAVTAGREPAGRVINVSTAEELVAALREPLEDVTIQLAPGYYALDPTSRWEEVSYCADFRLVRQVTAGVVVSGGRVRVLGPEKGRAIIHADATYQIFLQDCFDCELERITITSDVSDSMQYAGAAIGASESLVRVAHCTIQDEGPVLRADAGPLKWVKGICGRRGADLDIELNEIIGNAWGIVLYDDAKAMVRNNLVEGVGAMKAGGGGMLVTCDASATVERNRFHQFTNGIELSGDASVVCRANIIEDIYNNGIAATSPGLGRILIEENVIYRCGSAAINVRADGDQKASRNIIVETGGINPTSSAIRIYGARADAAMRKNTLYDNTVLDKSMDKDIPREKFWRARRPWTRTYRNTPVGVDGRHKFHESAFLTRYGRWMD